MAVPFLPRLRTARLHVARLLVSYPESRSLQVGIGGYRLNQMYMVDPEPLVQSRVGRAVLNSEPGGASRSDLEVTTADVILY